MSDLSDEQEQPFPNDVYGGSIESSSKDDTDMGLKYIPDDIVDEMVSVIMKQEAHPEGKLPSRPIPKILEIRSFRFP